jgi:hypothetical protein
MTLRHIAALGCAYLIGWAVVLASLLFRAGGATFVVIQTREEEFLRIVALVWACYTLPCLFFGLVLWELLRIVKGELSITDSIKAGLRQRRHDRRLTEEAKARG